MDAAGAVTAVPAESLPFQDTSTVPLFTETHPEILAQQEQRAGRKANAGGRRQMLQCLGEHLDQAVHSCSCTRPRSHLAIDSDLCKWNYTRKGCVACGGFA
mmetsp:Transcript_82476/g.133764  ORF Transcript_82476/g.133764 Transcript_82476/m.133764 type:complete len:101 (-) Transcript_82476:609-911(-)